MPSPLLRLPYLEVVKLIFIFAFFFLSNYRMIAIRQLLHCVNQRTIIIFHAIVGAINGNSNFHRNANANVIAKMNLF